MRIPTVKDVDVKGKDELTVAGRLTALKNERGINSFREFGARCDAPENTVKAWLQGRSLPGGAALRGIRQGFAVSADWVLTGVSEPSKPAAPTIHDAWRGMAPASIPEPWREDYGALVQLIGLALTDSPAYRTRNQRERRPTVAQAQNATLKIATAMMAEMRRQCGERKRAPESLLEDLRTYRGPGKLTMYLLWTQLAVKLALLPYRPSGASGTDPRKATKPRRRPRR